MNLETMELVELSEAKKILGSYGKIAELAVTSKIEICFRYEGYVAFATYDEYCNETLHSIECVNGIFVAKTTQELKEVISGTSDIYEITCSQKSLTAQRLIPKLETELISGWTFLVRNPSLLESYRTAFIHGRIKTLSGTEFVDKELYRSLRLTRDNLFVTARSLKDLLGHNPSTSKSTQNKPAGKSRAKTAAQIRAAELALMWWDYEQTKNAELTKARKFHEITETRKTPMARMIYRYFHEVETQYKEQVRTADAIANWLGNLEDYYGVDASKCSGKTYPTWILELNERLCSKKIDLPDYISDGGRIAEQHKADYEDFLQLIKTNTEKKVNPL